MLNTDRVYEILNFEKKPMTQTHKDAVRILARFGEEHDVFKMVRKEVSKTLKINERRVKSAVAFMLSQKVYLISTSKGKAALYSLEKVSFFEETVKIVSTSVDANFVYKKLSSKKKEVKDRDYKVYLHIYHNHFITVRELAKKVGVSRAGIENSINRLDRDGLLLKKTDGSYDLNVLTVKTFRTSRVIQQSTLVDTVVNTTTDLDWVDDGIKLDF